MRYSEPFLCPKTLFFNFYFENWNPRTAAVTFRRLAQSSPQTNDPGQAPKVRWKLQGIVFSLVSEYLFSILQEDHAIECSTEFAKK